MQLFEKFVDWVSSPPPPPIYPNSNLYDNFYFRLSGGNKKEFHSIISGCIEETTRLLEANASLSQQVYLQQQQIQQQQQQLQSTWSNNHNQVIALHSENNHNSNNNHNKNDFFNHSNNDHHQEIIKELEHQINELEDEVMKQKNNNNKKYGDLKSKITTLEKTVKEVEDEKKQLKNMLISTKDELKMTRDKNERLETQRSLYTRQINTLEQEKRDTLNRVHLSNMTNETLSNDIRSLQFKVDQTKQQLQQSNNAIRDLNQVLESKNAIIEGFGLKGETNNNNNGALMAATASKNRAQVQITTKRPMITQLEPSYKIYISQDINSFLSCCSSNLSERDLAIRIQGIFEYCRVICFETLRTPLLQLSRTHLDQSTLNKLEDHYLELICSDPNSKMMIPTQQAIDHLKDKLEPNFKLNSIIKFIEKTCKLVWDIYTSQPSVSFGVSPLADTPFDSNYIQFNDEKGSIVDICVIPCLVSVESNDLVTQPFVLSKFPPKQSQLYTSLPATTNIKTNVNSMDMVPPHFPSSFPTLLPTTSSPPIHPIHYSNEKESLQDKIIEEEKKKMQELEYQKRMMDMELDQVMTPVGDDDFQKEYNLYLEQHPTHHMKQEIQVEPTTTTTYKECRMPISELRKESYNSVQSSSKKEDLTSIYGGSKTVQ